MTFELLSLCDKIFFSGINSTESYVRSDDILNVVT